MIMIRDLQRMRTRDPRAGRALQRLRENLGLTVRDVSARSRALAKRFRNADYELFPSALCEIETLGRIPHIYRLASLSRIYGYSVDKLLAYYKVGRGGRRRRPRG